MPLRPIQHSHSAGQFRCAEPGESITLESGTYPHSGVIQIVCRAFGSAEMLRGNDNWAQLLPVGGSVTLLLGPVLRHISDTTALVWVKTESAGTVEVLG